MRRQQLCENVLELFRLLAARHQRVAGGMLFSNMAVTFVDQWGAREEGVDQGTPRLYADTSANTTYTVYLFVY